jgi:cytoskeletal protein CcmA (bactofilin family)
MFSSPSKQVDQMSESPVSTPKEGATVIARGVKLEGDFTSKGDVVIDGEVHGKVTAAGKLTVGSESVIHADITADATTISGTVKGNVTVKGQIILHATANLTGDLVGERIMVESGATLHGQVQIGPKASTPPTEQKEEKKEG